MKRLAVVALLVLLFCAGCHAIPNAIKVELDFIDTVVDVAIVELTAATNADDVAETSSRALLRLAPHTETLRIWAEGQEVRDDSGP
jgi:hypothetical protein